MQNMQFLKLYFVYLQKFVNWFLFTTRFKFYLNTVWTNELDNVFKHLKGQAVYQSKTELKKNLGSPKDKTSFLEE